MTFTAPTIVVKWLKARRREGQQRVPRGSFSRIYRNVRWLLDRQIGRLAGGTKLKTQLFFFEDDVRFLVESTGISELLPVAEPRLGRRTVLTLPLLPPPQKNRSPPSDSSPETATPGGISIISRTSPVCGSTRRKSLSSPSQVPCHSSPSIQVTPVTKRLDSIVRRIAPVSGSI